MRRRRRGATNPGGLDVTVFMSERQSGIVAGRLAVLAGYQPQPDDDLLFIVGATTGPEGDRVWLDMVSEHGSERVTERSWTDVGLKLAVEVDERWSAAGRQVGGH